MDTEPLHNAIIVWSIAGSDNSAGAGIAADIKTLQSFSSKTQPVHLCTLITAVTAQHSNGVDAVMAMPVTLLQQQADALLKDACPAVIKIGLLATAEHVRWLSLLLVQLRQQNPTLLVLYDPVAISSSGDRLAGATLYQAVFKYLLPQLDILTPNLPELWALTLQAPALSHKTAALQQLFQAGVKAIIVKGGHSASQSQVVDELFIASPFRYHGHSAYTHYVALSSPRQHHAFSRGTGCCFSSAVAAALALGYPLEDAFVLAKSYINQALHQPIAINANTGCPGHYGIPSDSRYLPTLSETNPVADVTPSLTQVTPLTLSPAFKPLKAPLGLYVIVPSVEALKRALVAGVKTLQLRIKQATSTQLKHDIMQAIHLCQQHDVQLFINDHWQLALELGAYGVHLGQEDITTANLLALQQAGLRLGVSSHAFYKLLRAQQLQPSYIAIGAIFNTQTKNMAGKIQGLHKLKYYCALFNTVPLVAIGGINADNAHLVLGSGITNLAMVQAFANATEPQQWVKQMQALISQHVKGAHHAE
ncbi:thiamine phosphate synthase [Rheinheimera baltica]|uniref:thiamine phosphate synthase n=1 Tax=Rheinheimera baltica TaxID=67576 RepID=UPI00273F6A81|nr:thiamine phosphate synthase [Rheinheimera baltica]MDP5144065.1 thiamine phosphate synthase [Rheinheimera baltica]